MKNSPVPPRRGRNKNRRNQRGEKYRPGWYKKEQILTWSSPPIWFKPKLLKQTAEAEANPDKKSTSKEETKEVELLLDPNDADGPSIKKKVLVLRNPDPESWIKWIREYEEICVSIPIKDAKAKALSAQQFLAGHAREVWQKNYTEAVIKNPPANTSTNKELQKAYNKIFKDTLLECSKEFFHMEQPARRQLSYMRYYLSTEGYTIREFANRLKVLNSYLPYFPPKSGTNDKVKKMDNDELVDILVRASPPEMAIATMRANIDPYTMNWDDILNYLERLELSLQLEKRTRSTFSNKTDGTDPK